MTRIYDIDLSVVVSKEEKEHLQEIAEQREAEIADRVAYIVRAAPHKTLSEPDLRVLKTQLLDELREITHDPELVQRVLVPKFVPIRAE